MNNTITVYGTYWCPDCRRRRRGHSRLVDPRVSQQPLTRFIHLDSKHQFPSNAGLAVSAGLGYNERRSLTERKQYE